VNITLVFKFGEYKIVLLFFVYKPNKNNMMDFCT